MSSFEGNEWNPCSGGHPGSEWTDEEGLRRCNRCGEILDKSECLCGEEGHEGLSVAYCGNRNFGRPKRRYLPQDSF